MKFDLTYPPTKGLSKKNSPKWISYIPKFNVITQSAYEISKCFFYTKSKYDCSTMQNNKVMVNTKPTYFTSSKDNNIVMTSRSYFGVNEEIWNIYYIKYKVSLFKCK